MSDEFREILGGDIVTGDKKPDKPGLAIFRNIDAGLYLLNKHLHSGAKIAIHGDVDVDGIGSTVIMTRFLEYHGVKNPVLLINKDKVHGIQDKHVRFFQLKPVDLLIILDSSSNEIDLIKQMNCDVLVIDHHEVLHNDLWGLNNDGNHLHVVINSVLDGLDRSREIDWIKQCSKVKIDDSDLSRYVGSDNMSCGLVVYEFLRVYCTVFSDVKILENLMLYQWSAVTLFTDAIDLSCERNQWYISNTLGKFEIEPGLKVMMNNINRFKSVLSKSFISYSFAPLINKAIRAGAGSEALDICVNHPQDVLNLKKYEVIQQEAIDKAIKSGEIFDKPFICKNVTALGVHKNYCGVIASKLVGSCNKNAAVYVKDGDFAVGSFRGRKRGVDYRGYFESYKIYAQGHKEAFGFRLNETLLFEIMERLNSIEPKEESNNYISVGNVEPSKMGEYHIDDFDYFKKQGNLWRLAVANSRTSSSKEISIVTSINNVLLDRIEGKVYYYNVFGMTCKAFEEIKTSYVKIYVEYSNDIDFFIRNLLDK